MENQPQVTIGRIYVKDLSFESPMSPSLFQGNYSPEVKLEVQIRSQPLDEESHEICLEVTATGLIEAKTAFIVEVEQAGVFVLKNFEPAQLNHVLRVFCPNILFPYARQTLDMAMNMGSLPPLMVAPINFEALAAQASAEAN